MNGQLWQIQDDHEFPDTIPLSTEVYDLSFNLGSTVHSLTSRVGKNDSVHFQN